MAVKDEASTQTLDVSDLDRYMGVPMQPGILREPITVNDIRRFVQGMHYPNPLHFIESWATESCFETIVAPQSFTVACDTSHGCAPASVGRVPDSHLIFGGDEWWFFGPRIFAGDHLVCHRMPYDYKVADTSFAGATCFQRGDTLYINQKGERVALQRSTSIRYQVKKAREQKMFDEEGDPAWSDEQLVELDEIKMGFIRSIHDLGHDPRPFSSVKVGDELVKNVLGPHSLASLTTEWRAYPMTTWGAMKQGPELGKAEDLGYTPEMAGFEGDRRVERLNPELTDGAYYGPSRGHLQPQWARHVGMGRGYGYGASMGAWVLDYVAAWAGEWGFIVHSDAKYRRPAFTGDASFIRGAVTDTRVERRRHLAVVDVEITNQDDEVMVKGRVEVELPE
ncbi:MAG TPA: MaoC family dehydratase N-terminal domain-containing protein [Acidimicrobiales bacterium]|nr:MaoC family dehydratase N-terminal domain-containing protein [Acidimicrobiales bacterium]